jgi:malate dehydrogenase (oxaloacetate-decarboxylating)
MAQKKKHAKVSKKDYAKMALGLHKKFHGKIEVIAKKKLKTKDDWNTMYTPGVGAVSSYLAHNSKAAREYTIKGNSVAVISDGSAVLGLGNIGPLGALPVMEGKCAILKEMAGIDGFPIVLDTQDTEEIIETIINIAPGFGAINLEDISAPRCFEIEDRLKERLSIPVMHDDQHGTAIVVLAGLINAAKVVKKKFADLRVVIAGAGAAGRASALLLVKAGIRNVIVADSAGIIYRGRKNMIPYKSRLAEVTNPNNIQGIADDAIKGSDVVIGVSRPGAITKIHIESMARDAIVFALANPIPEINPEEAKCAGARVVATGRSDFANQVNNSLAFPGIFRGALDRRAANITDEMKLKAAEKIAKLVKKPTEDEIIPKVTAPGLVQAVASVVR